MLFSIVIPVYNVADYLRPCVESVLANHCQDCEIILVDDGSTDGLCPTLCDQLAEEHPGLIRAIHQENRGLGGARNTAIDHAAGEYLLFLDSDDTIAPDCLSVLREAVRRHGADIVTFQLDMVSEDGAPLEQVRSHDLPEETVASLHTHPAMLMDPPAACSRLWRRSLFMESGIRFPERLWYEDLHTTGKLLLTARRVVGIEGHLYRYLVREGSIMNNANVGRNGEILTALDSLMSWYRERGEFETCREEFCGLALRHICYACARVLRQDARHPLLKELAQWLKREFPDFKTCKYYGDLSGQQRLILGLTLKGRCGAAAGLFRLNDALRGRGR